MSFLSDLAEQIQGYTPSWAPAAAPGSLQSLVDALALNKWSHPFGADANSMDTFAGGFSSKSPEARTVGRAVGSYFAGSGLADAAGGAGTGAEAAPDTLGGDVSMGSGSQQALADAGATPAAGNAAANALVDTGANAPVSGSNAAQNIVSDAPATTPASGQPLVDVPPGTPGEGANTTTPADKSLIGQAMDWVNAKPVNTLITGQAVHGAATGVMNSRAAEKKRAADRALALELAREKQRQTMSNPSVGGGGVNLNIRPSSNAILRRPDGTPVYAPGGIISRGMSGVRG